MHLAVDPVKRRHHLLALVALLGGCASTVSPDASIDVPLDVDQLASPQCAGGVRPALDDCPHGLFHADCGGEGGPTFACGPTGRCLWLATECVPVGFEASDCPLSDRCCHVSSDGEWPFASWRPPARGALRTQEDVGTIGSTVVSASVPDDGITVGVAPSAGTAPPHAACTEPAEPMTRLRVCSDDARLEPLVDGSSLVLRFYTVIELQDLLVEVFPDTGTARVFVRNTSLFDSPPLAICIGLSEGRPLVAATGSLTVSTLDPAEWSGVHGRLDATIGDVDVAIDF